MQKQKVSRKGPPIVRRCLTSLLLLLLVAQCISIVCLLAYGALLIPSAWANNWLKQYEYSGLHLQSDAVSLRVNGDLELHRATVSWADHPNALLSADTIVIHTQLFSNFKFQPSLKSLSLSNGTLFIPSIYSPSGRREPIVKDLSFSVSKLEKSYRVSNFAAVRKTMRLNGEMHLEFDNLRRMKELRPIPIRNFYETIADLLKVDFYTSIFDSPSVYFDLRKSVTDGLLISTQLYSPKVQYNDITGKNFQFSTSLKLQESQIVNAEPLHFSLQHFKSEQSNIQIESVAGLIQECNLGEITKRRWPECTVATTSAKWHEYQISSSKITINPIHYPEIHFIGSVHSDLGSVQLTSTLDAVDLSGTLDARGLVNILPLLPENLRQQIPEYHFSSLPYCRLQLQLANQLKLNRLNYKAKSKNIKLGRIAFDSLNTSGNFDGTTLTVNSLSFDRGEQYFDMNLLWNTKVQSYQSALRGFIIPNEYNEIMPTWWGSIFNDNFVFNSNSLVYGDFLIAGNLEPVTETSFYGSVKGENLSYKSVPIASGSLIFRGRNNYSEINQLRAISPFGFINGNIQFTQFHDGIQSLASIRYDIDAKLPIKYARNLVSKNIESNFAAFNSEQPATISFNGAQFRESFYPQFQDKGYIHLAIDSNGPVSYWGNPLDYLRFNLTSARDLVSIRELYFGYAKGNGRGGIDILNSKHSPEFCTQLSLKDADYNLALTGINVNNDLHQEIKKTVTKDEQPSSININLHVKGPTNDLYKLKGYGDLTIQDSNLGSIPVLGPLSTLLQDTPLNFTSFNLNKMNGQFSVENEQLNFDRISINGPQSTVTASGTMQLKDYALDMNLGVDLFGNLIRNNNGRATGLQKTIKLLNPLNYLLQFKLTGTLSEQHLQLFYSSDTIFER